MNGTNVPCLFVPHRLRGYVEGMSYLPMPRPIEDRWENEAGLTLSEHYGADRTTGAPKDAR